MDGDSGWNRGCDGILHAGNGIREKKKKSENPEIHNQEIGKSGEGKRMKILKVPIDKVEPWDENPKGIKKADYERLKRQIQKLGVYKPLVVCKENGKYVVLGGNMRIRALKELGVKEVEVSVVEAKTDREKLEYSLSDNDRAGFYEEDKLAEIIWPTKEEIDLKIFKVDLGESKTLGQILMEYGPDVEKEENGEIEFSEELLECHNYVVLYFDNEVDWLQAQTLFELKPVKPLHWKDYFNSRGIGRVLNGPKALEMLRKKFEKMK